MCISISIHIEIVNRVYYKYTNYLASHHMIAIYSSVLLVNCSTSVIVMPYLTQCHKNLS